MNAVVEQARALWGLADAPYELVAARENAVFQLTTIDGPVAMRLHRPGYRSDRELQSELQWMAAMSAGGIGVPTPLQALSGERLCTVGGVQVDVLSWLSGKPLDQALPSLEPAARTSTFLRLGRVMAQLHTLSDDWTIPQNFERCAWNLDGLLGEAPLWDRFWENPVLDDADKRLFIECRERARAELAAAGQQLDYGLIHADLVPQNVLVDQASLQLIDFDDGGFGYRWFDIATALLKHRSQDDYADLRNALLDGYLGVRSPGPDALELFMVLRALSYLGWNISRFDEAGGAARNKRFIRMARQLACSYLTA